MALDMQKIRQKLQTQRPVGVDRQGRISPQDPRNDGTRDDRRGRTTLIPGKQYNSPTRS